MPPNSRSIFAGAVVVKKWEVGVAQGPHWRHGWRVLATVVAGCPGETAGGGWPSRAALTVTNLMTLHCWSAAHLATLLLLATVVIVGAVAKPAPPPVSSNTTDHSEDDYYYYYDYYDEEAGALSPLNMSQFHLPEETKAGDGSAPHVPRYMLELYADQTSRHPHHILAADLVRSFVATTAGEYQ